MKHNPDAITDQEVIDEVQDIRRKRLAAQAVREPAITESVSTLAGSLPKGGMGSARVSGMKVTLYA